MKNIHTVFSKCYFPDFITKQKQNRNEALNKEVKWRTKIKYEDYGINLVSMVEIYSLELSSLSFVLTSKENCYETVTKFADNDETRNNINKKNNNKNNNNDINIIKRDYLEDYYRDDKINNVETSNTFDYRGKNNKINRDNNNKDNKKNKKNNIINNNKNKNNNIIKIYDTSEETSSYREDYSNSTHRSNREGTEIRTACVRLYLLKCVKKLPNEIYKVQVVKSRLL